MRSFDFCIIEDAVSKINHQVKLNIYKKMYRAKRFEESVIENVEKKNIKTAVYLSLGQESISAAIIEALGNSPYVFTQHRCHSIFLSLGGNILKVRDELLGLPTGCSNGKAGSNCLQIHENGINMFGHHGLIGENLPQAVGACFGSNHQTLCFIGDGAIEEDYVYPSIGFAVTHKLPIIIICEDNDLSILTKTKDRRSWDAFEMIKSLGVPSVNMSDDPWSIYLKILELSSQTTGPIFMNIKTCRKHWHVGVGTDNMEEWDRFHMVEEALMSLNLKEELNEIKREINHEMDTVWNQETLHQLLKK